MTTPGKFLSLEGITCTGKTTMGREIVADLSNKGTHIVFLREPTEGPVGKIVRALIENRTLELGTKDFAAAREFGKSISEQSHQADVVLCELLSKIEKVGRVSPRDIQFLFVMDGHDHLLNTIQPHLNAGRHVLLDRFRLSTFAFGKASGIAPTEIFEFIRIIGGGYYPMPEKTYYINITPETALARLEKDGKVKDEFETLEMIKKTAAAYQEMILLFRGNAGYGDIDIVDGEWPMETVRADLQKRIEKDLGLRF